MKIDISVLIHYDDYITNTTAYGVNINGTFYGFTIQFSKDKIEQYKQKRLKWLKDFDEFLEKIRDKSSNE